MRVGKDKNRMVQHLAHPIILDRAVYATNGRTTESVKYSLTISGRKKTTMRKIVILTIYVVCSVLFQKAQYIVSADTKYDKPTITVIKWDFENSKVALGTSQGTIYVVDTGTKQIEATFQSQETYVLQLAWSPDDRFLAASGMEGIIRIWDIRTHSLLQTMDDKGDVGGALIWNSDGTLLMSGGVDDIYTLRTWDVSRHQVISREKAGAVINLRSNSTKTQVAVVTSLGSVQIRDAKTLAVLYYLKSESLSTDTKDVTAFTWSSDGMYVALGWRDGTIDVWDVARKIIITTINSTGSEPAGTKNAISGLTFSPSNFLVSIADNGVVKSWQTTSGKQIATQVVASDAPIGSVDWSQYGTQLALGNEAGVNISSVSSLQSNLAIVKTFPDIQELKSLVNLCAGKDVALFLSSTLNSASSDMRTFISQVASANLSVGCRYEIIGLATTLQ